MKILDRYKISLHNIKNNKSRSILTTAIVYIISLLIIVILCIGISFANNTSEIIRKYYQTSEEPINVSYYNYGGEESTGKLDLDAYKSLVNTLDKYESIIDYSRYKYNSNGNNNVIIQEHKFPITKYIEIIEGENVSKKDSNTNNVLVSSTYAQKYYEKNNDVLKPGTLIEYEFGHHLYDYSTGIGENISKKLELKVVGIYKTIETEKNAYESNLISENNEVIIDANYLINSVPKLAYTNLEYYYNVSQTNFNEEELTNELDNFVTELNNVLPKNDPDYDSANSNALMDLKMSKLTGTIIIAVAAFLCLVLILLSIGSLANTIMISVDKNKKFIGLLKALGLNEKDLKSTIKMESITTIVLGVIFSFFTVFLFKGLIGSLNELLLSSMFSSYLSNIDYNIVFSLPIYVPIIVLVFFVFFTLLFARSSMSKIAKTDPMAVISEVA